jgi:hypothetical protein
MVCNLRIGRFYNDSSENYKSSVPIAEAILQGRDGPALAFFPQMVGGQGVAVESLVRPQGFGIEVALSQTSVNAVATATADTRA